MANNSGKIGVAVGNGPSGFNALKWTLANQNMSGDTTVYLLHVHTQQPISHVERGRVSDATISEARVKENRLIEDCRRVCREKEVKTEVCYAEGESVGKKLVEQIFEFGLSTLVLGTSSRNPLASTFIFFNKKSIPKFVVKNAPDFCSVQVIYKGTRIIQKDATILFTRPEIEADSTNQNIGQNDLRPVAINVSEKRQFEVSAEVKEYAKRYEETKALLQIALREQEMLQQRLQKEIQKQMELGIAVDEYKRSLDAVKDQREEERIEFIEAVVSLESIKEELERESKLRKEAEEDAIAASEKLQKQKEELERESKLRKEAEERAVKERVVKGDAIAALEELQKQMDIDSRRLYKAYKWEEIVEATNNFHEAKKLGVRNGRPVYKGELNGMKLVFKFLPHDEADNGFQNVVGHLAYIRHRNVVKLLGICRDCIVAEYMSNGSLEDHLTLEQSSPLPWYMRLKICSEVASGLLYLHSHPKRIAHHNLKPGNILLDHNFVSKISYVGIGELVHNRLKLKTEGSMLIDATEITEYTDPEYQRTGVFSCESDVYAFGIIMLQLLTGRPPIRIVNYVDAAVDNGQLHDVLDKSAGDWPLEMAMELACLALSCAEAKREDRPKLEKDVIPVLQQLDRHLRPSAQEEPVAPAMPLIPSAFLCPILQEIMEDPYIAADGHSYEYNTIKLWLRDHNNSPMTNLKLPHRALIPNIALRSVIKEFRDHGLI